MDYKLQDLIDLSKLQELQDRLYDAFSVRTAILDKEGQLLDRLRFGRIFVRNFTGVNPMTEQQCRERDLFMPRHLDESQSVITYRCLNGLIGARGPNHHWR